MEILLIQPYHSQFLSNASFEILMQFEITASFLA